MRSIVSPLVLWTLLGLAALIWVGMVAILTYHWNNYSKGDRRVRRMKKVFYVGSAVLFLSAISFIFSV